MTDVALGPGAEFDAIRRMLNVWGARASGIGDDAAVAEIAVKLERREGKLFKRPDQPRFFGGSE